MTVYFVAAILFAGAGIGLWRLSRRRKKPVKILIRIGAVLIVLLSPLLMLAFLVTGAMCGRYDFAPVHMPDGYWAASVSEVDCGAVDSFHSFVQIWSSRPSLRNPFASRVLGSTVLRIGDDPLLVHLEWASPTALVIRYPNDSDMPDEFLCRSRWKDVQIECLPYTPNYPYTVKVGDRPNPTRWFAWYW